MRTPTALWALMVIVLLPAIALAATPRGKPNSDQRRAWCNENLTKCLRAGNSDCAKEFPKASSRNICFSGVIHACNRSFGDTGSCMRAARIILPKLPSGQLFAPK